MHAAAPRAANEFDRRSINNNNEIVFGSQM